MSRPAAKSGKKKPHATSTPHVKRDVVTGSFTTGGFIDEDHLVVHRGRKAVGVVISMEELRYFQELEDRLDVREADKALADPRRTPYGEVRRKLGL